MSKKLTEPQYKIIKKYTNKGYDCYDITILTGASETVVRRVKNTADFADYCEQNAKRYRKYSQKLNDQIKSSITQGET